MSDVKLTMTPPQVQGASRTPPPAQNDVAIDSQGRHLRIRELSILEEARLVRMLGESSSNQAYLLGYVMPTVMVAEIDGERVDLPSSEMQLEASIQRLGRHGLAAVMEHITAKAGGFGNVETEIKNSDGRPASAMPSGS